MKSNTKTTEKVSDSSKNKRLKLFYETIGLSQLDFAKKIGATQQYISAIVNDRINAGGNLINRIKEAFPEFSEYWFLTGEGEMLNNSVVNKEGREVILLGKHASGKKNIDNWEGLPMFNVPITASFVESYRDNSYVEPQYYLYDPRFKDCDFGAIISGDSMHSEIRHGDFVACKEIIDTRFIVFGDIYYIVASNGLETCKYVNAGKDEEHLCLQAKNEKISHMQLPKDMLLRLYKVRGIVRSY